MSQSYVVSVEWVVSVVNADGFTFEEIEDALRDDVRREVEDNGVSGLVLVSETSAAADYGLRFVRRGGRIETQHPDDPVEATA